MRETGRKDEQAQVSCDRKVLSGVLVAFSLLAINQKCQADSIFDEVNRTKSNKTGSTQQAASPYPQGGTTSPTQSGSPYPSSGIPERPIPASGIEESPYPQNEQSAPYPTGGPPYPTGGQPSVGQVGNSLGRSAAAGLQNAVNKGIQTHGAGALDRLGRRVGIQGLGNVLNSPNGIQNGIIPNVSPYGRKFPPGQSPYGAASSGTPPYGVLPPEAVPYDIAPQTPPQQIAGDDGRAAWEAAGRRAQQSQNDVWLQSARQAEARGDWNQAAKAYRQATGGDELTLDDDAAAKRNHTSVVSEMLKRKARDPQFRALNMKWAYCAKQLLNQDYSGVRTNIDPKHTEGELYAAFLSLKDSDKGNGAWPYLCAVYWCSEHQGKGFNYIKAWNQLLDALASPRTSPSIKQKALVLQKHIKAAKELQQNDMRRAVFAMEQDIVWNAEHPHIAGTHYWTETTRYDDTHDLITSYKRDYMNTELWAVETYPDCVKDLKQNFGSFKPRWLKQLNDMMAYPNQPVAVPPGPQNEEPSLYCPERWEQLAFGKLDLSIGREFPKGATHSDLDMLPDGYMRAQNWKLKGK